MSKPFTRRHFVSATLAVAAANSLQRAYAADPSQPFQHGVASGDPLQDRVILWTRVTPPNLNDVVDVRWTMARDPLLQRMVASGRARTNMSRDFTVKIDAAGLDPGHTYYYQFTARGAHSPVGRTRTLPEDGVNAARLAVVSCANLPYGLFNVYALIAQRADLDCVLHLGDYIYEYANGTYGDGTALGRIPMPDKEIVTLEDYRQRYAQYKTDADLQAVHRQHPFICIWDDHEFMNNAWTDGGQNHNPELGEGDYATRKRAAIRAYFEWMPIREFAWSQGERIYRSFRFGDLADLLMLDTRVHGRAEQSAVATLGANRGYPANDPVINDPRRTLLGYDQEAWLAAQLSASQSRGATWRLLGQQVMMAPLSRDGGLTLSSTDQWGGYRAARDRLYNTLRAHQVDNLVVMTGDYHASWGNELTWNPWDAGYNPQTGRGVLGVEFVTPAVSSPGAADPVEAAQRATTYRFSSPHMKYVELHKRGYVLLDIDRERVQGEFWHVATVDSPSRDEVMAAALVNVAGDNRLQSAPGMSAARGAADPAS
jgi:alkaline phosphatase D